MNVYITIAFTCANEVMVRERIESLSFDSYGIDHEILSVAPGLIPDNQDECNLPDYREMHGLGIFQIDQQWSAHVPEGCTSYIAYVRLQDTQGGAISRKRILAIPFGDRDLGFAIESIQKL